MITKDYENPNKPVAKWAAWQAPHQPTNYSSTMEDFYAKKKNLTVEEYRRRDEIVRTEYAKCRYFTGSVVWPYTLNLCNKKGQYRIQGIYKAYHEYDTSEWPKDDSPFIVTAYPVSHPQETIFTTVAYFQIDKPMTPKDEIVVVDTTPVVDAKLPDATHEQPAQ